MTQSQPFRKAAVAEGHPKRPCVVVFRRDDTPSNRIAAFQACGLRVATFTSQAPGSDDDPLGRTLRRLASLALALPSLIRARPQLASADVFWARDLDLAALALLARWIAKSEAPLVYEVLEVPRVLMGRGVVSFLLRLAERAVLARGNLLVVGSPALMGHYFAPVQGYAAPWFLLEEQIRGDGGMAELCRRLLSRAGSTGTAGRQRVLARS